MTMNNPLDDNAAARDAILARVRAALAHQGKQPQPAARNQPSPACVVVAGLYSQPIQPA